VKSCSIAPSRPFRCVTFARPSGAAGQSPLSEGFCAEGSTMSSLTLAADELQENAERLHSIAEQLPILQKRLEELTAQLHADLENLEKALAEDDDA
jgi:hypothetical protein